MVGFGMQANTRVLRTCNTLPIRVRCTRKDLPCKDRTRSSVRKSDGRNIRVLSAHTQASIGLDLIAWLLARLSVKYH
jgi:hypothetical protein